MASKVPAAFVGLDTAERAELERETERWGSRNVVATMALRHWFACGRPLAQHNTEAPKSSESMSISSESMSNDGRFAPTAAATVSATAQPRPNEVRIDINSQQISIDSQQIDACADPPEQNTPPYRNSRASEYLDPDCLYLKQISSHTPSQDTAGFATPAALPPDEIGATPPEEPGAETPWPSVPGFSLPFEAPQPPAAARRRDEQPAEPSTPERPKRKQNGYPDPLRVRTTDPENGKVPPPTAMRLADVLDALRAANLGVDVEPVVLRAFTAYPRKNVEEAIKRAVKASGKSPAYALGILRKSLCREKGFEFELIDEALAARIVSDNAAYGYGYTGNKLEVTDAAS